MPFEHQEGQPRSSGAGSRWQASPVYGKWAWLTWQPQQRRARRLVSAASVVNALPLLALLLDAPAIVVLTGLGVGWILFGFGLAMELRRPPSGTPGP